MSNYSKGGSDSPRIETEKENDFDENSQCQWNTCSSDSEEDLQPDTSEDEFLPLRCISTEEPSEDSVFLEESMTNCENESTTDTISTPNEQITNDRLTDLPRIVNLEQEQCIEAGTDPYTIPTELCRESFDKINQLQSAECLEICPRITDVVLNVNNYGLLNGKGKVSISPLNNVESNDMLIIPTTPHISDGFVEVTDVLRPSDAFLKENNSGIDISILPIVDCQHRVENVQTGQMVDIPMHPVEGKENDSLLHFC
ncbi:hypothetical protein CEXT_306271 [Caerostris extrusa]|uniref:Uncharacterized protein n=1 Tax=Caerostris extrusa TaxID=172846 RepID=A0AAV4T7T7_CAEEX|nr:hypothetical protein CEXT_306271 [Caerostris extrusa]